MSLSRLLSPFAEGAASHKAELAGLGVLAAPSIDEAQAHVRAGLARDYSAEGVKKRTVLPHAAKPISEIAGLGILAAPAAGSLLKHAAFFDELEKLGAISDEHARRSLDRLDQLDKNTPTPGQIGRYGALGAAAGALGHAVSRGIEGGHLSGRSLAGAAASGAIGMGAVPLVRGALDRHAEKKTLKSYLDQPDKIAFASSYDNPGALNPVIHSGASSLPAFKAPSLRAAVQKTAASAPTRGNFMQASDIPSFRAPQLGAAIQKTGDLETPNANAGPMPGTLKKNNEEQDKEKNSDALPNFVTYSQGDFRPANLNAKHAAVPGKVKQYRRALQLLQEGTHDFHGGRVKDILASGTVRATRGDHGPGTYWGKGGPAYSQTVKDYFWDGGVAVPHTQVTDGMLSAPVFKPPGGKSIPYPFEATGHLDNKGKMTPFIVSGDVPVGKGSYAIGTEDQLKNRGAARPISQEAFDKARLETSEGLVKKRLPEAISSGRAVMSKRRALQERTYAGGKLAARYKLEGDAIIEVDEKGKSLGKGNVLKEKDAGGDMSMAFDPASSHKQAMLAMNTQELGQYVMEMRKQAVAGLTPASQLEKSTSIGAPKVSAPPGPSIADQVKPRGKAFGIGMPGAFKGTIG